MIRDLHAQTCGGQFQSDISVHHLGENDGSDSSPVVALTNNYLFHIFLNYNNIMYMLISMIGSSTVSREDEVNVNIAGAQI